MKIDICAWADKTFHYKGPELIEGFERQEEKSFHSGRRDVRTLGKGHLKLAGLRYETCDDQLR